MTGIRVMAVKQHAIFLQDLQSCHPHKAAAVVGLHLVCCPGCCRL